MINSLDEIEMKKLNEYFNIWKGKEKLIGFLISGRQKFHWPTSKSMQACLVPVAHLYQIIDKTVPPGESWQCTTKAGDVY